MRRYGSAILVLVFVCLALPLRSRADETRCFAQTGQCISGRFRTFWEQSGGLAVFGLPLGPARDEVNRDTGQTYLTQWFERNRFELHPENSAPYDVLLGRLGNDRLVQLNGTLQWGTREDGPNSACLWFEATGHNVCDFEVGLGFKSYWLTYGLSDPTLVGFDRSLALWGWPISEARIETNRNGDTVLSQWFERARFEWHPNKPQAYKVLLGLLGNEVSGVGPSPAPSETTPTVPAELPPTAQPSLTPTTSPEPTPTAVLEPTPTASPEATATPSPAATATAQPTQVPPSSDDAALKQQLFALVDPLHQQAGCAPFIPDNLLATAAQLHAEDIASHRRIDHVGTDGATLRQRLDRVGYPYGRASESIAIYQTPEQAVAMWMDEPPNGPHRMNITNCQYTEVGIGLATDSRGRRWWVMDIANRR